MKNYLSIICFCFFTSSLLAGGWPQPKGSGYFKLYEWWVIADRHYTDAGLIDPNVTNGIFNTSFYGEYGFTDRLTGVMNFPLFSRAYFNNSVSRTTGEITQAGEAINSIGRELIVFCMGSSKTYPIARQMGQPVAREFYADRDYDRSGSIVFTRQVERPSPEKLAEKCLRACAEGKVRTVEGDDIDIEFESICFHSDTPGALDVGTSIRARLTDAGIRIAPARDVLDHNNGGSR